MKPINQMLRDFREKRGVTQVFIAKKAGISGKRMSQLETGLIRVTVDEFLKICIKGYGVTPQIFFDEQLSEIERGSAEQPTAEN